MTSAARWVGLLALWTASCAAESYTWLLDGKSLEHWQTSDGQPVRRGWELVDGLLHLSPEGERDGNLVTVREYGDFELIFEWRISAGGNNGVKYRVRSYDGSLLGCEYQMIDDHGYRHDLSPTHVTGALYDVIEPNQRKFVQPVGQFNHSRIVVYQHQIQHWLNGQLIVAAQVGSPAWRQRVAASKFADVEGFAENPSGRIMLTDHNDEVWYRYMVIRQLPAACGVRGQACGSCETWWQPRARVCQGFRGTGRRGGCGHNRCWGGPHCGRGLSPRCVSLP